MNDLHLTVSAAYKRGVGRLFLFCAKNKQTGVFQTLQEVASNVGLKFQTTVTSQLRRTRSSLVYVSAD